MYFIKITDKMRVIGFVKLASFIVCSLLFTLNVSAAASSGNSSSIKHDTLVHSCEISQYQCENGRCIDEYLICDGMLDCADGSDETHRNCFNMSCAEDAFQCHYGGCIKKKTLCDGLKQCIDGSDESPEICNVTKIGARKGRAANDLCVAPAPSPDKTITYTCDGKQSQNCNTNGYVREFTVARIKCNPNYSPLEDTHFRSVCHDQSWIPPIDNCYRKCDRLNPLNVDLQCYRRGVNIPCDENKLLAGVTVRPTCKPLHTYRDFVPTYQEIYCREDGQWDKTLFACDPECGKPYTDPAQLISGGVEERFGDSPWHVAVYNQDKILICGGTIINPYLVVSAAHCFHDQSNNREDASNYEIVVSKYTRDYTVIDNKNQKVFKLREIRYSNKGYIGINNYFAADIAILILQEKLTISPTVLPACVDWAGLRNRYPTENTPAKVVGWGKNEHGKLSERLMTAELPYISRERCLNNVPDEFKAFITFDKFCAGSENGPGVLQGDSGGGLLFRVHDLYYLRGIVSLKQPSSTAVAAFTDLADHIDWILSVRNEIEREWIKKDSTLPPKKPTLENVCKTYESYTCVKVHNCPTASDIISNNRAVVCGYDSNNAADSICCPIQDPSQNLPPTLNTPPYNTPFSVATAPPYRPPSQYNTRPPVATRPQYNTRPPYSYYAQPQLTKPTTAASIAPPQNSPNYPTTLGEETAAPALPREYPHMAVIGYGTGNGQYIDWGCDGALISERFVISAAHCGNTSSWGEPKWVMLGVSEIVSSSNQPGQRIYSIVKRFDHPSYKPTAFYNDVTVFMLNTSVAISPYIRPACLYSSAHNPINTKASATGWGTSGPVQERGSRLQKSTITVVEDEKCRTVYQSGTQYLEQGYDSNTMVCAGDSNEGGKLCAALAGSPLQIPTRNQTCSWIVIGVKSFGTSCGNTENALPDVYSKVSYHLDWIQRLVNWPI